MNPTPRALPASFIRFQEQFASVIAGQQQLRDALWIALLTEGHLLLEGLPGLAKTLSIKTFAQLLGLGFQRVSFTPDLLPADILGTRIYIPASGQFQIETGPIFAPILLADEVNRAPAKVQSALLEAMEERQVTIARTTFSLPKPFLVLATQNPLDQEGTFPLPEASLDRFLMKLAIDYPTQAEEAQILERFTKPAPAPQSELSPVMEAKEWLAWQEEVRRVYVEASLADYVLRLVRSTRESPKLRHGASPRASLALYRVAQASAWLAGRDYVLPGDVQCWAGPVLHHRLRLSYEAEADGLSALEIVDQLVKTVPIPAGNVAKA